MDAWNTYSAFRPWLSSGFRRSWERPECQRVNHGPKSPSSVVLVTLVAPTGVTDLPGIGSLQEAFRIRANGLPHSV